MGDRNKNLNRRTRNVHYIKRACKHRAIRLLRMRIKNEQN